MVASTILLVAPETGHAQSILGRVTSAPEGSILPDVEVRVWSPEGFTATGVTDGNGMFSVGVPSSGSYRVQARKLGYLPSDSAKVDVESSTQEVEVTIRLSASPLELEGLTVVARGIDLRHRATIGGFWARREQALDVGRSRIVSSDDPEMRTAFDIGDVMQWFPARNLSCIVYYVDGRISPGWVDANLVSVEGIEGIEFYRSNYDAPLAFRGGGPPCIRSREWAVVAIWRKR